MKIAVTGKGGVGKTTFAATLARLYAAEGRPVLAADVDPDANLGLALGFDEETLDSIVPISKMRKLVEERTGATAGNQFYHLNPKWTTFPINTARSATESGSLFLVLCGDGRRRLRMSGTRDAETYHQQSCPSQGGRGDPG